jgi:hypothetical protein
VWIDEFKPYAERCLKIKAREGGALAPFVPNFVQGKIDAAIEKQLTRGTPAKVAVLKSRRLGVSTYVAAKFSHRAFTRPYQRGLVVAHKGAEAKKLFAIYERMYENLPLQVASIPTKPRRTGGRGQQLLFHLMDSSLEVSQAGSSEAGRGGEAQMIHLSECAFYPDPEGFLQAMLPSFHKVGDGLLILESTAGIWPDDWWSETWKAARDGENGYEALFFGWYEEPSFRMPFAIAKKDWTEEERFLVKQFKVDGYQLAWLREVQDTDCFGNEDRRRKEYPATPEEAFTAIGDRVWSQDILNGCYERRQPEYAAHITAHKGIYPSPTGGLLVWEEPLSDSKWTYVIGVDPAAGVGGDLSAATVWKVSYRAGTWPEQVAEYTANDQDPVTWAGNVARLGLWYKKALIACEINGVGYAVEAALQKQLGYPNLHRWIRWDHTKVSGDVWGWETTWKSKQIMLGLADWLFRTKHVIFHSAELYEELLGFQILDSNGAREQYEGVRGDDRLMSMFIAWCSWFQNVYPGIPLQELREQLAGIYGSTKKGEANEEREWARKVLASREPMHEDW